MSLTARSGGHAGIDAATGYRRRMSPSSTGEPADAPGVEPARQSASRRTTAAPRARRHDPARRDRIIDACLEVIAEHGVGGTSHRRVAAAADVPLGSMTYHFDGRDELLREAFSRFADQMAARVEHRMAGARTRREALAAFAANIGQDVFSSQRELIISQELYTLAARRPEFRDITVAWMARTRATLAPYVDPDTAVMLDAINEGLSLHRALHTAPSDPRLISVALERLTARDQRRQV